MPLFLKERDTTSKEQMDDPNCDRRELFHTYEQFSVINSLISRWNHIYQQRIRPACTNQAKTYTLLDIGFGGGDLPIKIYRWAKKDGIRLHITAIETDRRAYEFVQHLQVPPAITFRNVSSTDLLKEGKKFDFVVSNHLLHHLTEGELLHLLDESKKLSAGQVLFNDIERSDPGYLLFNVLSRLIFRSSFITQDGLTSIRRSYTARELRNTVPEGWKVHRIVPYRLLLSYEQEQA